MRFFAVGLWIMGWAVGPVFAADSLDTKTNQDVDQVKKDYEVKVHKDLRKIGKRIARLKKNAENGGQAAGDDFSRQMKKLDAQKAEAYKKLLELEKSTGDAWKDLRQGVDEAVANLRKAVDEAAGQFQAPNK